MCLGARPRWFATRSSCPYGVCSQPRGGSRPRRNVGAKGSQNDKSRPVIETAFGEGRYSANDSVGPFPRFRLRGFDLDHVPADKPANAVILPVGRLCDLSQRRAFLPCASSVPGLSRPCCRIGCHWPCVPPRHSSPSWPS